MAGTRGPFGAITQRVDLPPGALEGRLVSEVQMTLFDPLFVRCDGRLPCAGRARADVAARFLPQGVLPGVTGTVVSEARLRRDAGDAPTLLRVTVESTRVVGSNFGPPGALDAITAPVETVFSALRGGQGPLEVPLRTKYADAELRIARTGEREDQIFVFVRG